MLFIVDPFCLLFYSTYRGLTSIVGRLVEQGSNLMVVDMYGATPLHYAAQLNHTNTVELVSVCAFQ